jgi:ankyrin repeat protein
VLKSGNKDLEYTKEILRTMLIVFHHPTPQELAVLAGLPQEISDHDDRIRTHISKCGSFLKIVADQASPVLSRVQFMDTSARDHLEGEAADDLGHHKKLGIQHGVIALRCLTYLGHQTAAGDADATSTDDNAMTYPAKFWVDHAKASTADLVEDFGLEEAFWEAQGTPWWPKLSDLTKEHPKLTKLTLVHLAAFFDFRPLLEELLRESSPYKTQLQAQDSLGRQPLYWAAREGHVDTVKLVVKYGSDINATSHNSKTGVTTLHGACECGRKEVVEFLLSNGAVVDVPNRRLGTALCAAAAEGHTEVALLLLEAGASKDASPGFSAGSALGAAVSSDHTETAKALINAGCNVNCIDEDNEYPLEVAIFSEDLELVQLLLSHGANTESRQRALETAAEYDYNEMVKLLLLDSSDLKLDAPFVQAASQGNSELFPLFPRDRLGPKLLADALYVASDMEHEESVKKLLEMGADPNAKGDE